MSEDLAKTLKVVKQIQDRADAACAPLLREMQIMKWAPQYRVIMWEELAHKAAQLALEAGKEELSDA